MPISPKNLTAKPDTEIRPLNWRANWLNKNVISGGWTIYSDANAVIYDPLLTTVPGYTYNQPNLIGDEIGFEAVTMEANKLYDILIVAAVHGAGASEITFYHGSTVMGTINTFADGLTFGVYFRFSYRPTIQTGTIKMKVTAGDVGKRQCIISAIHITKNMGDKI